MATLSKFLSFNVRRGEPELVRALTKSNTSSTPRDIKHLSDIDDQEGLRFLVPIIFFYPPPESSSTTVDPVQVSIEGLAKALEPYYPLAGRVFEGPNRKLMVDCNNEGVVFVEAEANLKLEQLGDGILPPCPHAEKLFCSAVGSGAIIGSPLMYIQITRFICGGLSMGILVNHTLVDAGGLMQFLKAIAELANGASAPSVPPVWQRELLNARSPPKITCIHNEFDQTTSRSNHPPRALVYPTDTFILTSVFLGAKDIQALRAQMPTPRCSTFDVITACLWKCRTVALEPHPDDTVPVSMLMNVRHPMFGMNLPRGYYGNAITYPAATSKASALCMSPLAYAADLIKLAKLEMGREYVKSVADLMVIRGRPKYVDTWNFIVSDLIGFGFDKMDFGWGKPTFGGVPWAMPVISFYNRCRENGVVVPICLPSLAMDKFQYELMKMTREPISKI